MHIGRFIRYILCAAAILLSAASCTSHAAMDPEIASPYAPAQIADVILASVADKPPMLPLLHEDARFADYLSAIYQLDAEKLLDGAIFYAGGMHATEIAVMRFADAAAAAEAENALSGYIAQREIAFRGYAPLETKILNDSLAVAHGAYAALLICSDPLNAKSVFLACFDNRPPELPDEASSSLTAASGQAEAQAKPVEEPDTPTAPNAEDAAPLPVDPVEEPAAEPDLGLEEDRKTAAVEKAGQTEETGPTEEASPTEKEDISAEKQAEPLLPQETPETPETPDTPEIADTPENADPVDDVYDPASILAAWTSGDSSALSEKNRTILAICAEIIAGLITADMDAYDKELAIHDWIIDWADYDSESLSNAPDAKPDPDNDNPYGLLVGKRAVCMGYTTTFQLFMDMLNIECITVRGAASSGEHAWNMVRLDGEWYCVDLTWNDPSRGDQSDAVRHQYFNVTSDFMRRSRHFWDEGSVPEATAGQLYKES
ncbi:MAG: DUF4358 domain-containing protein [Clostridiales bacterium]|nr:DUF4358 domain-containing protein [Clostridiales bacterium]